MTIDNDARSTARPDERRHSRIHLMPAGVAMERGDRRVLHNGRRLWLRSLAWLVLLFFLTAAAFGLPSRRASVYYRRSGPTGRSHRGALDGCYGRQRSLHGQREPTPHRRPKRELARLASFTQSYCEAMRVAPNCRYAVTWVGLVPLKGLAVGVTQDHHQEQAKSAEDQGGERKGWDRPKRSPQQSEEQRSHRCARVHEVQIVVGATVTLAGLMFCALYALTGRLWVPIGLHLAWNFAQGSLFGAAVSGGQLGSSVVRSTAREATEAWLTGGTFGPEASVLALLLISLVTIGALVLAHLTGRFVVPSGTQS